MTVITRAVTLQVRGYVEVLEPYRVQAWPSPVY
jgi:hypothetical protein